MSKTSSDKLSDLISAVRALPTPSQDFLVQELEERVAEFTESHLNAAQRMEIKRRLALPRSYATDEDVHALLRRYNPDL